ncbi:MAG: (2Fe-2S)-binding protein [Rhodospirillaceae bacterium]|nr:(2Fe-2S)-binding protein [Rhodospirillaceae bacterium]MCA8934074.1 (2Fe-2S)-binding protein [Rhodospirillaceae bacterium]
MPASCPTGWKRPRPPRPWRCSVKTASPFLELEAAPARATVWFDGEPLDLPQGANLAAALLAAGVAVFRHTPASGAPRGPFCLMGACFDCLVEIDGVVRQACMLEVEDGLRVTRPHEAEDSGAPV